MAKIDDVLTKLESIDRWRAAWEAEKQKHSRTLYGNGEPGHDEMIRGIFAYIKTQNEAALRRAQWWDKLQWVLIPLTIGGVSTFVFQAFIFFFRVWPVVAALQP